MTEPVQAASVEAGLRREFLAKAESLQLHLEQIEYALRKDSLTDNERVESARILVNRALSHPDHGTSK